MSDDRERLVVSPLRFKRSAISEGHRYGDEGFVGVGLSLTVFDSGGESFLTVGGQRAGVASLIKFRIENREGTLVVAVAESLEIDLDCSLRGVWIKQRRLRTRATATRETIKTAAPTGTSQPLTLSITVTPLSVQCDPALPCITDLSCLTVRLEHRLHLRPSGPRAGTHRVLEMMQRCGPVTDSQATQTGRSFTRMSGVPLDMSRGISQGAVSECSPGPTPHR